MIIKNTMMITNGANGIVNSLNSLITGSYKFTILSLNTINNSIYNKS